MPQLTFKLPGGKPVDKTDTPSNNQVVTFNSGKEQYDVQSNPGGGEANTSSNSGTGEGLALAKVGVDLPFKSLIGDTEIVLTGNANDVTFSLAADIARLGTAQTWTAKQTFGPDATNPGINFGGVTANPSAAAGGDVWFRSDLNLFLGFDSTTRIFLFNSSSTDVSNKRYTSNNRFNDDQLIILNPLSTNRYTHQAGAIVANRVVNYPVLGGDDTFVFTGFSNVWGDGVKQTFNPDATNAGINVGAVASDPTALANADIWSSSNLFRGRTGGVTRDFVMATSDQILTAKTLSTDTFFSADPTFNDGIDIILDSTTGTSFGTATTQKLSFYGVTPIVQVTLGADLTNSVTSGGTDNTIADYSTSSNYNVVRATIRDDIFQLARSVKIIQDGLRDYGLLS